MAALGIVETRGLTAAVETTDSSAVAAGEAAARAVGGDIICVDVIASPHPDLEAYLDAAYPCAQDDEEAGE